MKSIPNLQDYRNELIHIFQNSKEVDILLGNFKKIFLKILLPYSYLRLPKFTIIPTESLEFSIWYEDPEAITETLNIHQGPCDLYFCRCADHKWYLDDLYDDLDEIADKILNDIPIFHRIPENPKEVKTLLENGLIDFKPEKFPIFSANKIKDFNEVLTWDDRFLLVGTKVENLKIYSYKEWNDLIIRENHFKNNGE